MAEYQYPEDVELALKQALTDSTGISWSIPNPSVTSYPQPGTGLVELLPDADVDQFTKRVGVHMSAGASTRTQAWRIGQQLETFMLNLFAAGSIYIDERPEREFGTSVELVTSTPPAFIVDSQWRLTLRVV